SNSGADLTDVFVRATKPDQALQGIPVAEYYSRYSRGFARFIPTVHMFNEFKKIEKTDQRYGATIRDVYTIAPGLVSAKYPLMKDTAIYFTNFTATSAEGQAAIAKSYNKYRLYTLTGGDLPLYTSADESVAVPYSNPSGTPVSALYGDNRYNTKDHMGEWTFLALQKFEDNDFDFSSNAKITPEISERDYFCIRISEMYLIKAECQLHTGGDALATLNQLRSVRAIPGKNNSISGPVTIDTILRERMFELAGEYQRWFDLRRTGKLIEYVKAYNGQANGKNASSFGPGIQDYHMLRPIPQAQMDAVTNVTVYPDVSGFYQNPGY
ncbi:MAG: RagB/SusD family nutrient uptake outer membrane protein, partial [Prevotella sp.]|nr:RagB/SusD family nutrient uptake outer membrane protein [Prevotella sp.]